MKRSNPVITITNGAIATDGGSIGLEAMDAVGRPIHIDLDWSIAAQRAGTTALEIDGVKIERHTPEEKEWIESLKRAHVTGGESVNFLRSSLLQKLESQHHGSKAKLDAPGRVGPLPLP